MDGINYIEAVDDVGLSLKQGRIHTGGNSGYQAIGLAFLWGAVRIVLLGYDMQRTNGMAHWHGEHKHGLPNLGANLPEWVRRMQQLAIDFRTQGVDVVNCTRETAIRCFEQVSLAQTLISRKASLDIRQDLLPVEYEAFVSGLAACGCRLDDGTPDASVVWAKGGSGDVLVAENGYLAGQGGPYVALALGGHNGAGQWPDGDKARFEGLGVSVRRWRENGQHILVCPSRGIGANPMPKDWTAKTVARLKALTNREIRVRAHPGNWKNLAEHPDASLRADLEGAWCCVTWASTAGIRALTMGIPVISCAPHWICADAAGHDLDEIENPPMPERMPVFYRLATAQWSLDEIASGKPIQRLLEMAC